MSTVDYSELYIGGEWAAPRAVETFIDAAVAAARVAFDDPTGWAARDPADRSNVMERFAEEIR
ncbi:hypothetical protein [Rhodococcus opacus]|uniref:hypothetical protein n=1 Tax=Rhodococcus opacus TaxID=37919 RepID=UPI001C47DFB7|nr:hypothetical protein [Rhodococcus opacus]MBV6755160.1 hypothetical protein [Rhodococcus opacus]